MAKPNLNSIFKGKLVTIVTNQRVTVTRSDGEVSEVQELPFSIQGYFIYSDTNNLFLGETDPFTVTDCLNKSSIIHISTVKSMLEQLLEEAEPEGIVN
jgi:hypothetical protein